MYGTSTNCTLKRGNEKENQQNTKHGNGLPKLTDKLAT